MKMNFFQYKNIYLSLLLLAASIPAAAQQSSSPAALEKLQRTSFWKRSGNAAGARLDQPFQYSILNAGYEWYDGNFKRPQQGVKGNLLNVNTEGNLFLGDYYVTGSFSFIREAVKEANYNASIIDPYRGMPYIIADMNPSDWNKQYYDLQFALTSPVYREHWTFGFAGDYQASSGAKQRDIRTDNRFMQISVSPSVVYSITPKQHFGLNLSYKSTKEEASMRNVNTYIDQTYYELMGLGTAISRVGSGRSNNYIGDALSAGIQFHSQGAIGLFVSAGYAREAEDLQTSFEAPNDAGTALRHIWNAAVSLNKETDKLSHVLDADFYKRDIDGIQYITERDNSANQLGWITLLSNIRSTYSTTNAGLKYSLMAKRDQDYSWMANVGVQYQKLSDQYLLPATLKQTENVIFSAGLKKNAKLSERKSKRLLAGLDLGYSSNLSGIYNYGGAHADYPTVTDLEQNDFRYLSASYASITVPVVYSQKLKEESQQMLFVKASFQGQFTNSYQFSDRYFAGLNVGVIF